jgi:hypothetical protein
MWKSFVEVAGLIWGFIIFLSFFLGLNKAAHYFTKQEMNFWTYMAFPVGAIIPWFVMIGILLWIYPGGTDPATGQTGFLPLAGYAAVFSIPIYVIATGIGSFTFTTEATVMTRFFMGTTITSSILTVGALVIFILRKTGLI